jgi:Transposase
VVRQAGRIQTTPQALREFAASLCTSDEVAVEATGNSYAIARLLERQMGRVVISNPQKTRAIAEAKVKTDKVDAAVLAQLLAAGFLPSVWLPDEATFALRRQVARRAHLVRQRTRLNNQVQSILHRNLVGRCPAGDLFCHKGRAWLAAQDLPPDEQQAVKGAQRRSCSSPVLMEQTTEQVTSVHPSRLILADGSQPSLLERRLQSERPVRPMSVVVLGVDPKDLLEVGPPKNEEPVQALGAHRPDLDPALRVRVRLGARTGVTTTWAPSQRNTSSKLRQNFASRSRSRNRTRRPCSPSTSSRLRAAG